jgi:hypothetical protein
VARALGRLREECAREHDAQRMRELLDELAGEPQRPGDSSPAGAPRHSPGAQRARRCRMKAALAARLRRLLREELASTAGNAMALAEEVRELLAALS